VTGAEPPSLWLPLRSTAFRALWSAQLVANVGTWMHTTSAQWVLTSGEASATEVAAVQTAVTLPFFLLALPAGALADAVDRRRVMFAMQVSIAAVSGSLAVACAAGHIAAPGILVATLLMGSASAVSIVAWQSMIPELVDRAVIPSAATLDGMSFNSGRILGPAAGGLLLSFLAAQWVFGVNALVFALVGVAFWVYGPRRQAGAKPDGLASALITGLRFVRYSPLLSRLLLRMLLWSFPASVIWALLPLVAHDRLDLGARGFGILFSTLGIGAVAGGLGLPVLRRHVQPNGILAIASCSYAMALLTLAAAPPAPVVGAGLVVAGGAWIAALSTMMAMAQSSLPPWVRSRGLATVLLVHQGCQAFGSLLWGLAGDLLGIEPTLALAGVILTAAGISVRRIGLRATDAVDPVPVSVWTGDSAPFDVYDGRGPVLVTVEYAVPLTAVDAFVVAVEQLGRSRRRIGARRWQAYEDTSRVGTFVEAFVVLSWGDHVQQETVRWTRADKRIRDRVEALADGPPTVRRLVAVTRPGRTDHHHHAERTAER
jgi:MFS family permease